jgi:hypothetical protein
MQRMQAMSRNRAAEILRPDESGLRMTTGEGLRMNSKIKMTTQSAKTEQTQMSKSK